MPVRYLRGHYSLPLSTAPYFAAVFTYCIRRVGWGQFQILSLNFLHNYTLYLIGHGLDMGVVAVTNSVSLFRSYIWGLRKSPGQSVVLMNGTHYKLDLGQGSVYY